MKGLKLLALSLFAASTAAQAQKVPPVSTQCPKECMTSRIAVNTGYDWQNGGEYAPEARDGYWRVTMVPTGSTSEPVPFCAYVLEPYSGWEEFTPAPKESQYISALPGAANAANNWYGYSACNSVAQGNPYRFERHFRVCASDVVRASVDLEMLSDNLIDNVMIDGVSIKTFHICNNDYNFHYANRDFVNETVNLAPGDHVLSFDLRNVSGVAMGANIQGTITTEGEVLVDNRCETPNVCKAEGGCFEKSGMDVKLVSSGDVCKFEATAYGFTSGTIIGYEWILPGQAPFIDYTSANTSTQSFTVPMWSNGQVTVIIHAVNQNFEPGQSPCCTASFTELAECGGKDGVAAQARKASAGQFTAYPNPAEDRLTLESTTGMSRIDIVDARGTVVRTVSQNAATKVVVSLDGLAAGLYMIRVDGAVKRQFSKLK